MPTIAATLGIDLPWATDGSSLFGDNRTDRAESRIEGNDGVIVFGTDGSEARAIAFRKIEHFGTDGPFGLAPAGYADLLGRPVEAMGAIQDSNVTATVRDIDAFKAVDPDGPFIPAWISGTIARRGPDSDDLVLGIAVNGHIAAITRTSQTEEGATQYGALIPPESFVNGTNDVDLYLIRGSDDDRALLRILR